MTIDATTMAIISAVGTTGVTVGGVMWKSIRALHNATVKELKAQNAKLETRTTECEEDRKNLHGRLNDQSERITNISQQLGRLEGRMTRD
jgi:septal ring factor EnvC (AmiA/AmiB activator)